MIIRIITIHFGTNHGSALQSYALCYYLNKLGHDVKVIDYVPERYGVWNDLIARKGSTYPKIILLGYYLLTMPKRNFQRNIFMRFLKKNVPLTRHYNRSEDLMLMPLNADIYITGSDQVWNYDYNSKEDYSYFLNFVPNNKIKVAYAASFGKDQLSDSEVQEFKPFLKRIDAISVREYSGLNILKQCSCLGINVLDPIFLLNKEEWKSLIKGDTKEEKYLLIYVMDGRYEELLNYAKTISVNLKLKIYVVSFNRIKDKRINRQFVYATPCDFLRLIYNASYIVTNSFHGMAFAINFHKQFIAVAKKTYDTRLTCLLDMLGMQDRFVDNNFYLAKAIEDIDYIKVTNLLDEQRRISKKFLNNCIVFSKK